MLHPVWPNGSAWYTPRRPPAADRPRRRNQGLRTCRPPDKGAQDGQILQPRGDPELDGAVTSLLLFTTRLGIGHVVSQQCVTEIIPLSSWLVMTTSG
ncbi:hypothetical protein I552_9123 [Mycobacterium xenopi 3993]|nr:hypothetical protein I552_9123 [Mycobacterium xenopi 3993]